LAGAGAAILKYFFMKKFNKLLLLYTNKTYKKVIAEYFILYRKKIPEI